MKSMDSDVEAVLKMLRGLPPVPTGPVELSPEYLRAVERVESHPSNQSGVDKTWVGETLRRNRAHFARARLR